MTSVADSERHALATLAGELGPEAPTLCEGWDVRDLLIHMVVREGSPLSLLGAVPPLRGLAERPTARQARRDFPELLKALRDGPPLLSPFAIPVLGNAMNAAEYFVHHEDIRRAQPEWSPRTLPASTEDALWRVLRVGGRALAAKAPVGVRLQRSDPGHQGGSLKLRGGDPSVVVRGAPSELLLFLFGRQDHAEVELVGDDDAVAQLAAASLGV